ncbi:hypothetical protein ACSIGC_03700 [Tenacibaculum sp. ZS6-P6]|uniref:hypothetical protein n=1 Tax=Tenacibaculum sp. ZS6-P6 TaxID=3447503 RepID=UPI003F956B4D
MEYKKTNTVQRKEASANQVGKEAIQLKDNRTQPIQRFDMPGGGDLEGNFNSQFFGGLGTATANVLGFPTQKLLPFARRFGELPKGREELQQVVEPYRTGEDTLAANMAEMITGQNGAQSLLRQPVGPEAILAFQRQLSAMHGAEGLPMSKQYGVEFSGHMDLMKAFGKDLWRNPSSGFGSGVLLHGVGAGFSLAKGVGHSIKENPQEFVEQYSAALEKQFDPSSGY